MANVKATDLIDFTRASKGHALAKVSYGSELVENGTFDSGTTGWYVSASGMATSVVNGEINLTNTAGSGKGTSQGFKTEIGKTYKISATARVVSGNGAFLVATVANVQFSGNLGSDVTTSSSNTELSVTFTAVGEESYVYLRSDQSGVVIFDNVSVQEVLFNQPDGSLQLFEHPNNIPRIEYDADGNLLGLLIEEARTNLFEYSNLSSGWTSSAGASIQTSYADSPENLNNATALIASSTDCRVFDQLTLNGSAHSFSIYAKKGVNRYLMLRLNTSASQYRVYFDLQDGVFASESGGTGTNKIEDVGNGWYRCSISTTDTSTSGQNVLLASTNTDGVETGSLTSGVAVYLYGAQLEAGSFPTSYMKTQGSTVSRSADIASIDVDQFGYNQSEGTVVQEFSTADTFVANENAFSDGTNNNRIMWGLNSNAGRAPWIISGGTNTVALTNNSGISGGVQSKLGIAFALNDVASSLDGGSIATDTSATIPSAITTLYLGVGATGTGTFINGHIKSLTYTPKRLSNAKLQELTS